MITLLSMADALFIILIFMRFLVFVSLWFHMICNPTAVMQCLLA